MVLGETDFAVLAVEQFDMLYGLARRLSGSAACAEDLVQETYLRALRARESFRLEEFGIRPWLIRILHNLYVTRATRESHQPIAVDQETLSRASRRRAQPRPESVAGFEDMDEELVWAIQSLPESYRQVLLLWAVEGLSYAQIGQTLSLPLGTVMSRLHRARRRISTKLPRFVADRRLMGSGRSPQN